MAKFIPAAERIARARKLIQQARSLPVPDGLLGKSDLTYVASVKDLLRQARDLVRFVPLTSGLTAETKAEANRVLEEIEQANRDILR